MLHPRSYIFIGLNAVRAFSLIALILVFSSGIFVLVRDVQAVNAFQEGRQANNVTIDLNCEYIEGSTVPNQAAGVFWAVLNRLLIIFQVIMLFMSEIGWPTAFFERFFPVLGPNFGLGALGIFQALIGATVLSHHVDDFTLVSAFFLFSVGCLNMLLGLVFRESAKQRRSIALWREDSKSALPTTANEIRARFAGTGFVPKSFHTRTDSSSTGNSGATLNEKAGYGFGRQGEKASALRGIVISKPVEALPRYATPSQTQPRAATPPARSPVPSAVFSDPSRYSHASAESASTGDADGRRPPPTLPVPTFQSSATAF
jgi:hypothetical protein